MGIGQPQKGVCYDEMGSTTSSRRVERAIFSMLTMTVDRKQWKQWRKQAVAPFTTALEEGRWSETGERELEGKGFCDRHALMTRLISKLSLSYLGIWSNKALFCHLEIIHELLKGASALEQFWWKVMQVQNITEPLFPNRKHRRCVGDVHKRRRRAHTRSFSITKLNTEMPSANQSLKLCQSLFKSSCTRPVLAPFPQNQLQIDILLLLINQGLQSAGQYQCQCHVDPNVENASWQMCLSGYPVISFRLTSAENLAGLN